MKSDHELKNRASKLDAPTHHIGVPFWAFWFEQPIWISIREENKILSMKSKDHHSPVFLQSILLIRSQCYNAAFSDFTCPFPGLFLHIHSESLCHLSLWLPFCPGLCAPESPHWDIKQSRPTWQLGSFPIPIRSVRPNSLSDLPPSLPNQQIETSKAGPKMESQGGCAIALKKECHTNRKAIGISTLVQM